MTALDDPATSTTNRSRVFWPTVLVTLAFAPVLRWAIARFSTPPGQPWRRACPQCGTPFGWQSRQAAAILSPLGRCGRCGTRFGAAPFVAEVGLAALVAVAVSTGVRGWPLAAYCWWAAAIWLVLSVVDAKVHRLPDVLVGLASAGFLLLALPGGWASVQRACLAGLAYAAVMLIAALTRHGMGLGDVKAAFSLGAAAGWISWPTLLISVFTGFGLLALWGIALVAAGRASWRSRLAAGPFLLAGVLASLILH